MKPLIRPFLFVLSVLVLASCASVKQTEDRGGEGGAAIELSAEAANGKVTLQWEAVPGADSYNVYMSTSPGTSKRNFDARRSTSSTSFTWKGLTNGEKYYFAVT